MHLIIKSVKFDELLWISDVAAEVFVEFHLLTLQAISSQLILLLNYVFTETTVEMWNRKERMKHPQ